MPSAPEDGPTESEPFLDDQSYGNNIELGERTTTFSNDGEAGGAHFDKSGPSLRDQEAERDLNGSPGEQSRLSIIAWRLWTAFLPAHDRRFRHLAQGYLRRNTPSRSSSSPRTVVSRWILRPLRYLLMFLGALQLLAILVGIVAVSFPRHFGASNGSTGERTGASHWPTDFTADILPVRCHSHNDYWREVPVFSALQAGCVGIEADVWLFDSELYVGHTESSLTPNRTFKSLYVYPLVNILGKQNPVTKFQPLLRTPRNGVFDTDAEQPLVLLVDFKTNGDTLWSVVQDHLEPLRSEGYLSYFNGSNLIKGPVTVVATGNAPFHKVVANSTYRDIFFDAPLPELGKLTSMDKDQTSSPVPEQVYDPSEELAYLKSVDAYLKSGEAIPESEDHDKGQGYSGVTPASPRIYTKYNSYYASTSLTESIGAPFPYFSSKQRQQIEAQIEGAHVQGLQVRYWGVPSWPVSWRHYLWRELIQLGIDYLNVDDLLDATKGDWLSNGTIGRMIWGLGNW